MGPVYGNSHDYNDTLQVVTEGMGDRAKNFHTGFQKWELNRLIGEFIKETQFFEEFEGNAMKRDEQ